MMNTYDMWAHQVSLEADFVRVTSVALVWNGHIGMGNGEEETQIVEGHPNRVNG